MAKNTRSYDDEIDLIELIQVFFNPQDEIHHPWYLWFNSGISVYISA